MQVSVVIPTYYRRKDVDECLDSILRQTNLPKEVLIADNTPDDEIENLIKGRKTEFKEKNVILEYIRNPRKNSIAIAQNIGIENATGDIILFLDSDVVLDEDYIKVILKMYKEKPDALGVQGLIQNLEREKGFINKLCGIYDRIFYIHLDEKNKFRLLPSLGVSFPSFVDKIINCEWLSGANNSYRKEILEEFRWDENLKKINDIDLPYRIFKKYPSSLFMTPYAKLIHKGSPGGRNPKRELVYMDEIYYLYLFYKNIDQNLKNKLIYLWGRVGRMIRRTIFLVLKPSKSKLVEIKYALGAIFTCMKHIREIKKGDLEFFNKGLS